MFLVSYLALNIFEYLLSFCGVCVKLQKASSVSVKVRTSNGHLDWRQEKDPIAMAIVRAQSPSSSCCRSNGSQNMPPLMDFLAGFYPDTASLIHSHVSDYFRFSPLSGFESLPGSHKLWVCFGIWYLVDGSDEIRGHSTNTQLDFRHWNPPHINIRAFLIEKTISHRVLLELQSHLLLRDG